MNKKMLALRVVTSLAIVVLLVLLGLKILPTPLFTALEIAVLAAFFILQYVWERKDKEESGTGYTSGGR